MLKGSLPEVFLDTDVAFDILSKRKPHFEHSVRILEMAASDKIALLISESSLTNLIYLSFDIYKLESADKKLLDFISTCSIISGGKSVMIEAISSLFKDKEDALQYYTALNHGADYFITRIITDYKHQSTRLPVLTPKQFISQL
ncbi:MAG: PIN domain-containing protein [Balneolaceae bacterium]|nr:PIN domain-containing protein [Balneolaceae bacterium]MCH8547689.1 PIN domain-containing protein [Balneolaceae bacterium]